ncbi:hypothetical protein TNIN_12041 [Trichonephila inaurata madagascariensis]|uniref:Uncharacterized protein n=1 Tax=Trichonephila inaurata madagascariensis TaxID=2747483 RepID=A0A8X6M8S7_9ARAC|nr:hypothetical protein TNIN_12041 [Trichonephila inaurata madagascariensis]
MTASCRRAGGFAEKLLYLGPNESHTLQKDDIKLLYIEHLSTLAAQLTHTPTSDVCPRVQRAIPTGQQPAPHPSRIFLCSITTDAFAKVSSPHICNFILILSYAF